MKKNEKEMLCRIINGGGMWVNNNERDEFLATIKKSGLIIHGGAISASGDSQYFYID